MSGPTVVSRPALDPKPASSTPEPPKPARRRPKSRKRWLFLLIAVLAVGLGIGAYWYLTRPDLPPGFAGGNGRLEANEVYIASKYSGRVLEVLVDEGDTVEAGQIVARMDTSALEAQLRQAEAEIAAAQDARRVALTEVDARRAEYQFAARQNVRSRQLVATGAVSSREAETDTAQMLSGRAQLAGAQASVVQASSTINAARATADRLRAEIADAVLVAPIRGRIETRLAEPGEVVAAGGRVLSMLDLADVYMYVFLPEKVTGKVRLGSEARIVLDAAQQYPVRAVVSYVSPAAQFTPKTVETEEERHNLTFRVKLQIPRDRLRQFEPLVKSGLPGMGYVRFDESAAWPERLVGRGAPPANLWQETGGSAGKR